MQQTKSTHGGANRNQGRKTKEYKQQTYSFRCYPHQIKEIREIIAKFKENARPI